MRTAALPLLLTAMLLGAAAGNAESSKQRNGMIAFVRGDESGYRPDIWLMEADGSRQRNLTRSSGGEWAPAWSPDGKRLVFEATRPPHRQLRQLYVMNVDGSGLRRLTPDSMRQQSPAWSPNGRTIAFLRGFERRPGFEIYLVDADGRNLRSLGHSASGPISWSPDGSQIAFTGAEGPGLMVMNADGSEPRRITERPAHDPSWSPDGRRIVFTGYRDLWLVNADGTGAKRLANIIGEETEPVWSPDGTLIAFMRFQWGLREINVVRPDGSGLRRLTRNPVWDSSPAWQAQ